MKPGDKRNGAKGGGNGNSHAGMIYIRLTFGAAKKH